MKQLDQPFTFSGQVITGDRLGGTIDFPTANFNRAPDPKDLELGVYYGTCRITTSDEPNKIYHCLAYFGPRYIVGDVKNSFEVHLYNFNQQIYGSILEANLTHFLRAPEKFNDQGEFKLQLQADKQQGLKIAQQMAADGEQSRTNQQPA